MKHLRLVALCAFVAALCGCCRTEVVYLKDYGLTPQTPENAAEKIRAAFNDCVSLGRPVELRLEKGEYDIEIGPDESLRFPALLVINEMRDFTFNGGGSTLWFRGLAGLAFVSNSSNIRLENFSLDWRRPYITEAELVSISRNHIDIKVDSLVYPYKIIDCHVKYVCDDGLYDVVEASYCNFLTPQGKIVPGTTDAYDLYRVLNSPVEVLSDGTLRFRGEVSCSAPPGSRLLIYHVRYKACWCNALYSEDIILKDIVIRHCTGCGFMGDCCQNILIDNVDYVPAEGRVFTGVADAFHISHASGLVEMRNCDINGQGDDALNVHGRYYRVESVSEDGRTLVCSNHLDLAYVTPGDSVWFVPQGEMTRSRKYAAEAFVPTGEKGHFEMKLTEALDVTGLGGEFYVENATRNPEVRIHDNHFGSGNRARGILLTSPEKTVVEDNVFESSGAAILIEGDLNYWYESGGVRDVQIRNNVFDRCRTSAWGAAVIALTPSTSHPGYHSGVVISGNKFIMAEGAEPLYSVDSSAVTFAQDNVILRER